MNVLVVDDSPLMVHHIVELIEELDCVDQISSAESYDAAVDVLSKKRLDIILLDINLPGKNGIELLKYVKMNYPAMKIIMISNQGNEYYEQLCIDTGADHFLDKSGDFEKLPLLLESYA